MAKTYSPSLTQPKDRVRILVGDHRTGKMVLEDAEINAIIDTEKGNNVHLAASTCGHLILARAGNTIKKRVDDLEITYGDDPETAFRTHLDNLRKRGAQELLPTQSNFMMLS